MPDHIAIKLLTEKSDLGWFKSIFEQRGLAGKQKGITLGAGVIRRFYPSLSTRAAAYRRAKEGQKAANARLPPDQRQLEQWRTAARSAGNIAVFATIYGPNGKKSFTRERVIALQDKNWRLNGKFILDPDDDPGRFHPVLQDEDIAVIGFEGVDEPTSVSVLLLAAGSLLDQRLHAVLRRLLSKGAGSMIAMEAERLAAVADDLALPIDHPLRLLAKDTTTERDIEEAACGSAAAAERVRRRRRGRALTPEELAAGKAAAERNGTLGEELVNQWLETKADGGPSRHRWVSAEVANAPYDFELLSEGADVEAVLDVKTTSSRSTAEFFVSQAELEHAAGSKVPYHIWRVYEVGAGGAWLVPSRDFRPLAAQLLEAAVAFPKGTRPSVVAISPARIGSTLTEGALGWGRRMRLPPVVPLAPAEEDFDGDFEDDDEVE